MDGPLQHLRKQPVGNDLFPKVLSTSRFSPFLHGGHCPIGVCCVGARETCSSGRTTQRDVDGQLCSVMERLLQRTDAPASRQTLASVLLVGVALIRRRPERGHAARCLPRKSNLAPQTHPASESCRGSRDLSRANVRKTTGCSFYSKPVGQPGNTSAFPGPKWERRWAWSAALD